MQLTKRVLTVGKLLKGSDQDSRYVYSKLRIDPDKGYAECTNGHWLVRVPLERFDDTAEFPKGYQEVKDLIYLDFQQTQDLLKRIPKNPLIPILKFQRCVGFEKENGNTRISFSADTEGNALTIGMETDPGQFPPTEKIWPKKEPLIKFHLSGKLLTDLIKTCDSGGKRGSGLVTFEVFGAQEAVKLSFPGEPRDKDTKDTTALLMPMHRNGNDD